MDGLLILGAGGFGRTVAETAHAAGGFGRIAFLDDGKTGENILGLCGQVTAFRHEFHYAYPAFGENNLRDEWLKKLERVGFELPVLVHPRAFVSPSARLAPGAVVLAMAAVGANAVVGRGAIVNMGVIVDHDCAIGACAHLAPGAIIKAGNTIPARTKIDSGRVAERWNAAHMQGESHV